VATLRDIRRRIRSVESTQKITRAMQMVAAAKFNRAQADVQTLRPFAEGMEGLLAHFLSSGQLAGHPLLAREEVRRRAYVVVASDRGLCGAYNSNILRAAEHELRKADDPEGVAVIPVGRRASDFFGKRSYRVLFSFRELGDRLSAPRAREIAWHIQQLYIKEEVDQIDVLYTRFINTMNREVIVRPMLGIQLDADEEETGVPYLLEPSVGELLDDLLPRVLFTRVTAMLGEVFASEHSARMTAMQLATDNATELIDQLTLIRNRMRQAAITKELADIVGAAEAIS
jgi:F-type H+-transporting ATPase subunit gamma